MRARRPLPPAAEPRVPEQSGQGPELSAHSPVGLLFTLLTYRQAIYRDGMDDYVDREMLHGHVETLVLAMLDAEPLHGYGLRQRMADRTAGELVIALGRLYPLLAELERRRLVVGTVQKAGRVREKRVYALTDRGRDRLAFLVRRWTRFSSAVQAVVKPGPGKPK